MKSERELFVDAKDNWLKDCEICNAGLCATIDNLLTKTEYSLNSVCQIMAEESNDLYTWQQIKQRYLYHHNKAGRNSTSKNDIDALRREVNGQILLYTPAERLIHAKVYELTNKLKNTTLEIKKFTSFMGIRQLDRDKFGDFCESINFITKEFQILLSILGLQWGGEIVDLSEQNDDEEELSLEMC